MSIKSMTTFAVSGAILGCAGTTLAGDCDSYSGGTAVVVLVDQFQPPIGANVLGINFFGLPGAEQFWPCVNGGQTALFDPTTFAVTAYIDAVGVQNDDGSYTLDYSVSEAAGAPFVTNSTNLICQTLQGPQEANRFVIDFGNGYQQPGFPVDGYDVDGPVGNVYVDVEYWFARVDGTENREYGDVTGPFVLTEGFTFAWGYIMEQAREANRAGFIATFRPGSTSGCPTCTADLDGNCVVDGADLSVVLGSWGDSGGPADLDGSGDVDGADLSIILGEWGNCTP
jgi:hypothetical protein